MNRPVTPTKTLMSAAKGPRSVGRGMSAARSLLSIGPIALALLFLIRAVLPTIDPVLLVISVVLSGAVVALVRGSRIAAGIVLLLALGLLQPNIAREISFNLSSVDEPVWRLWAIGSLLGLGWTLIASILVLIGEIDYRRAIGGTAAGLVLGVALVPVFTALSAQPGFGRDLTSEELDALPVIELLNYRYEPPIVSVSRDGVYRARLTNPSDLPHTVTIDAIDLEVFVPAGRWSVIEIQGSELSTGQLELFCSIGDHLQKGMKAQLEIT